MELSTFHLESILVIINNIFVPNHHKINHYLSLFDFEIANTLP